MLKFLTNNISKNIKVMSMVKQIRKAIINKNIVSYFQPIVNNKTKKIEKYESLVRLLDVNNNILLPDLFLGISKNSNDYCYITQQVLENSFLMLKMNNDVSVAINLSMSDIENKDIRNMIDCFLDEYAAYGKRIIFELLEDERINNFKLIITFINRIKKRGVKIAIDDFGSGYSNYERIFKLSPDIIKIDGSIIGNLQRSTYSQDIVESLVYFSKKQGIKTVGEWVENESTYDILRNIGVDYSQGYYFGKPEMVKFLKKQTVEKFKRVPI